MESKIYWSIGSDAKNDSQIIAPGVAPFHILLLKDEMGRVFVCPRMSNAKFRSNGIEYNLVKELSPSCNLEIAHQSIDWRKIFKLPPIEFIAQTPNEAESQSPNDAQGQEQIPNSEQNSLSEEKSNKVKGINLQLVLIYTLIALMLFLLAFYI